MTDYSIVIMIKWLILHFILMRYWGQFFDQLLQNVRAIASFIHYFWTWNLIAIKYHCHYYICFFFSFVERGAIAAVAAKLIVPRVKCEWILLGEKAHECWRLSPLFLSSALLCSTFSFSSPALASPPPT